MNTLIVYSTKYGCTEKCARMLAKKLEGRVDLCNLKKSNAADLAQYDKVIVGGSVYIGRIQKEVREFCSANLETLKNKKAGYFICCMRNGEEAEAEINEAFPQELLRSAAAKDYFGGEFIFKKMNFMERMIVKKVSKIDKDTSNILEDNISRFAQLINAA